MTMSYVGSMYWPQKHANNSKYVDIFAGFNVFLIVFYVPKANDRVFLLRKYHILGRGEFLW